MIRLRSIFCCAVLLLVTRGLEAQQDGLFSQLRNKLRGQCAIPIFLPHDLPDLGQGKERIYAIPDHVTENGYTVLLAFTPDCNGASFCRLGSLAGRTAVSGPGLHGRPVLLAGATHGFFRQASCGAGCSDGIIDWQQGKAIYSAGLKGAKLEDVRVLANAVLAGRVQ